MRPSPGPSRILSPLAAAALGWGLLGAANGQDRFNSDDYRAVGRALVCQCGGCNALVHECAMDRCPSSNPIREEIAERLQAGDSPERIVAMFRERYGLSVLAAPPTTGFHLTAWMFPIVFLAGGAMLTVFLLRRWGRRRADRTTAPPEAPPEVIARIEREVARIR